MDQDFFHEKLKYLKCRIDLYLRFYLWSSEKFTKWNPVFDLEIDQLDRDPNSNQGEEDCAEDNSQERSTIPTPGDWEWQYSI